VGDATSGPIRLSFNPQLRVEFRGATVISDTGLLLPREWTNASGLMPWSSGTQRTRAPDTTGSSRWRTCSASRSTAAWRATRTPTTPRGPDVSDAGLARAAGNERRAYLDTPLVRDGRPHEGTELL